MTLAAPNSNYHPREYDAFIGALKKIGHPAVEFLVDALKSDNKGLKFLAVQALVTIKDDEATEPLIATLMSLLNEPDDRQFAGIQLEN